MSVMTRETRNHLFWETALDRLELDVIRAERLLDRDGAVEIEPWDEPLLDGPMPPDLLDRAVHLRSRQEHVQVALTRRIGATRRQHAFADRVDRATGRGESAIYVDIEA